MDAHRRRAALLVQHGERQQHRREQPPADRIGAPLALEPWLGVATMVTWVIVALFFRYSSLASIVTAVFAPAFYLFGDRVAWSAPGVMVLSLAVMGVLLVWRHADNINRLLAGKESKLGAKK